MVSARLPVALVIVVLGGTFAPVPAESGPTSTAIREAAEYVMKKFGRGPAGNTLDEVAESTAKVVAKHGDEALPFIRSSGHAGFKALAEAGDQAPDVIRLYARKGDEAVWIISEPKKLAIFLRHGDSAADALLRHPGIADDLVERFGLPAADALNSVSRPAAQRMGTAATEGLFTATPRSPELFSVLARHGDQAMDFIWRNKGALTATALLASFLNDPEPYFSGARTLIVDPVVEPIVTSVNWTWVIVFAIAVAFLAYIAAKRIRSRSEISKKRRQSNTI